MSSTFDQNIGHATAYGYYRAGYTGSDPMTEEEFTEAMGEVGTAAETAVEAKIAAQAAQAAAEAAQTGAQTARTGAETARSGAETAETGAAAARAAAEQAQAAAETAQGKAESAQAAAESAQAAAENAQTAAESAQTATESAQTAAETAQEKAEDAQEAAETAAAGIEASAAQIEQNTEAISSLSGALTQLSDTKAPAIFEETSGSIASFADGADSMPIKTLVVNVEPVQSGSGDPSPNNIRPISGWTGANITRANKNLFDKTTVVENKFIRAANPTTESPLGAEVAGTGFSCSDYIKVPPNTKVTMTFVWQGALAAGLVYYSDKAVESAISGVSLTNQQQSPYTGTTPANCNYIRFSWKKNTDNDCQVELGATATNVEAQTKEVKTLTWQDEAGTVFGGYVDALRGKLVATWTKTIFEGSSTAGEPRIDSVTQYTSADGTAYFTLIGKNATGFPDGRLPSTRSASANTPSLCNMLSQGGASVGAVHIGEYNSSGSYIRLCLPDQTLDTKAKVNAWLAEHPLELAYELATPIEYDIEAIDGLETLFGTNNIFADCGSIKSVLYPADTKLYIDSALGTAEDNLVADAPITSGTVFSTGSRVFKASTNISQGETISPGTNCTETDIIAQINALYALV